MNKRLKDYLDKHEIEYDCIDHPPTITAEETAQSTHISGKQFAKTVIVNVDGRMAMAVVHAPDYLDLDNLRRSVGAKNVRLATEEEFKDAFPDCELGAMPPFGNLYGMEVFVERDLPTDEKIVFNAGTHSEALAVSYGDFYKLVEPTTVHMTRGAF